MGLFNCVQMVLVSKEQKRKVFTYLLKEGVIVVKKDAYMPAHGQVTDVPNLQVMMITKSLKSRGCLNEVYNWGWLYYFLTDDGVKYLIKALGLPADAKILPATHPKKVRVAVVPAEDKEGKEAKAEEAEETPTPAE